MTPDIRAQLSKAEQAHKYDHGHALILSGGVGKGGAARLAARGALRIGAGLVTLGCPPAALIENASRLDAIMTRRIDDPDTLAGVLSDARITATCIGPGLGVSEVPRHWLRAVLIARRPTVLDADAITLIAQDAALRNLLHADCILTPHDGEFARLHPDLDRRGAAREASVVAAAKQNGCTVLLKGPVTLIADPTGDLRRLDQPAPWLATAGSGDVLAGFIAGLLARGLAPIEAATTGAWLHVACARKFGPGLIAEDLPEMLPRVLVDCGL